MATNLETKSRKQPKQTKVCLRCGKVFPITDFYANRDWVEQLGHDGWCKECYSHCSTKDEVREYCWANNREFSDRIWNAAMSRAEKQASLNQTYQKASDDRRARILERLTCQYFPAVMTTMYKYVDNTKGGKVLSYQEAKDNGEVIEEIDENLKYYSKEFNGYFKKHEIEYLENYYNGLQEDFELTDTNRRDIARKLAKASLQVDKAQDAYMAGRSPLSDVKDAVSQFDLLSKSGDFAACKRKPGDNSGMNSWSEITMKLESSGHPCTRQIEWEKDDVDKTIEEFKYIVQSLSLDTV